MPQIYRCGTIKDDQGRQLLVHFVHAQGPTDFTDLSDPKQISVKPKQISVIQSRFYGSIIME